MFSTYRYLFRLFDRREKIQTAWLMLLVLVLGLLELAGVASILPFLAVLSDPGVVERSEVLARVFRALGFAEVRDFLIFLAVVTAALIVVGQALRAVTVYLITRFSGMRELALGVRLLSAYLHQPYAWFLESHSADLGARLIEEVGTVVQGALLPALRLIVQVTVTVVILALLFLVNPMITTVTILVIGVSYGAIAILSRRFTRRLGQDRMTAHAALHRATQEAFGDIKTVKLMGAEESYVDRYRRPAEVLARRSAAFSVVRESPRYLLEAVVFGGMISLLLGLMLTGDGTIGSVLPTIGLFAFAGARLFPAVQQIYSNASSMRFNQPALERLAEDLASAPGPDATGAARLTLEREVALSGVSYRYPTGTRPSLTGVDMAIPANRTVGVIGRSGSGKTTAVDVILGLLRPESGVLSIDGVEIGPGNRRAWQAMVGYVPQDIFLTDESVAANIALGTPEREIDHAAVERAARAADLHEFISSELPDGYATLVGDRGVRLSGGQRQRVGIARAVYRDPPVLVLDEATSALDSETERAVMGAVQTLAHSKTIILIAHRLTTVRFCDLVYVLENGTVQRSGPTDEVLTALSDEDVE